MATAGALLCTGRGAAVTVEDRITAARGGRAQVRASDSDRERVLDMLKAAFVQGRLTKDELDVRVGQTLVSRTWGDLSALTTDIPAWAIPRPVRQPARKLSSPPTHAVVKALACAVIALAAIASAGMPGLWTMPAPASLTAQACQTFFGRGAPGVGSSSALAVAAIAARDGSDPNLAADLPNLLVAVQRSEFAMSTPQSLATRELARQQVQNDSLRVQADCLTDRNRPPVK